jgi:hypothetical protein
MIFKLTGTYLYQAAKQQVRQAKTQLVFTTQTRPAEIIDTVRKVISNILPPLYSPEIEKGAQIVPGTFFTTVEQGVRLFIQNPKDTALSIAELQLRNTEGTEILNTIAADTSSVTLLEETLLGIPEQRAWNIIITFFVVTGNMELVWEGQPVKRLWLGSLRGVEINGVMVISIDSLLRGKRIQYNLIEQARANLDEDMKKEQDEAMKIVNEQLTPRGIIQHIQQRLAGDWFVANIGITLSFPEYRQMIANLAGLLIPGVVRAAGIVPIVAAGSLFAFFALLPRVFGGEKS